MNNENRIRASFVEQAGYCQELGSLFMRDLLSGLADTLDTSTKTGKKILSWQGAPEPKADALALRLAGALHGLARRKTNPVLDCYYEAPARRSEKAFLPAVLDTIRRFDNELLPWLQHAPQTNEVARSSMIYAGLCVIADRFNLPIALYETGCSGGLNLQCADFGYIFGRKSFGNPASSLQLSPDWKGLPPPQSTVSVIARNGCDLNPLSVCDPANAARLIAYLWPDQPVRIARVEKAIDIARRSPPEVEKASAEEWITRKLSSLGHSPLCTVIFSTIAWNYFSRSVRKQIIAHIENLGAKASSKNPLARLAFEFDAQNNGPFLTLQTWPGTGHKEILASADPHVYQINWN